MSAPSASEPAAPPPAPEGADIPAPTLPFSNLKDPIMSSRIVVRCDWDKAAGVYFVCGSPVPGLVTTAPTMPALLCKLPGMIRALLGLEADAYLDIYVERVAR